MAELVFAEDGIVEDADAYPLMLHLVACLGGTLEARGLPTPCFLGLVPGDSQYLACGECDDGKCGSAWVRLVREYPSLNFPAQEQENAKCGTRVAWVIEVGVIRCAPTINPDGSGPGVEEQLASTRVQLADKAAMKAAIACCVQSYRVSGKPVPYVLGSYSPSPFMGGCGGGSWEVTIGGAV